MNKNRALVTFGLFYLFFYACITGVNNYYNVYLERYRGFSGTQLGLFNGLSNVCTIMVFFLVSLAVSRLKNIKLTMGLFLVLSIGAVILIQWQAVPAIIIANLCLQSITRYAAITMSDSQISGYCAINGKNYGFIRGLGSLGGIMGGIAIIILLKYYELNTFLMIFIAGMQFIALVAVILFPMEGTDINQYGSKETSIRTTLQTLVKNKQYCFIVLVTVFSCISLDANASYIGNHLVNILGADDGVIGLNTVFCIVPEMLFLPWIGKHILPRLGFKKLYLISAVVMVLRCVYYYFAPTANAFIFGSLFHFLSIGCFLVTSLEFIYAVVPGELYGSAVVIYGICNSVGRAVYGYASGVIYDIWGSPSIFIALAILNAVLLIVICVSKLWKVDTESVSTSAE